MPKTVILGAARTPFGRVGRLRLARRDRARRNRHRGGARAGGGRARAGRARRVRPGLAGRSGSDPEPPGADQGGIPKEVSSRRSTRSARPGSARPGWSTRPCVPATSPWPWPGGWSRCRTPLHAPAGALRLPHGRRQGARCHGPRRPHQPFQRQAHGRGGGRGRRGARDHPGGHGPLCAALARARGGGDGRGPAARGDRAGHGQLAQGRHHGRGRRGAPAGQLARVAGEAARRVSQGRRPHRRQRARRERRRGRSCCRRTSGRAPTAHPLATIVAQAAVADDFRTWPASANAAKKALEQAGLSVDDIDLFEINEAFASVALNSVRMLEVDEAKVNVNGGAIALGHDRGRAVRAS